MQLDRVLSDMLASARAMKGGPVKGALLRWAERFEVALAEDAAVSERRVSVEPVQQPALHGIYDNRVTGFRETYAYGVLQARTTSAFCPRNHAWGKYPDVPR